jgi:hypothetical protein
MVQLLTANSTPGKMGLEEPLPPLIQFTVNIGGYFR